MKIINKIAHRSNYGLIRTLDQIKYIIIHYTANDGDKAVNNASYFQSHANLRASAHYFVDDNNIYQSVLDNFVAYSVGGAKWSDCSKTGGGKYFGKCNNTNSLNIELCDTSRDGAIYPTQATINLAIELTKYLMKKYNISADRVIRHFDVNGKHCPAYWMDNTKWAREFHSKLAEPAPQTASPSQPLYRVRKSWGDSRSQIGAFTDLANAKALADKNSGYSVFSPNGDIVYTSQRVKVGYSGGFPIIPPTLIKGSQGSQVIRVQKFINWYFDNKVVKDTRSGKYIALVVDGDYGTKTKTGVLRFQQEVFPKESAQWDGKFGPNTLARAKVVKK